MKKKHNHVLLKGGTTKAFRIMKIYFIFSFITLLNISAGVFSQNQKFNISVRNAKLTDVFEQIEKESDISFYYRNEDIDPSKTYTVSYKDKGLSEILDDLLQNSDLTYRMVDNFVAVMKSKYESPAGAQQQKTIKGKVVDKYGDPIPGVSVYIKGTTTGTTTDINGNYSIKAGSNTVLVYSFIGYEQQEIPVGEKNIINVTLMEKVTKMQEVVVTALGIKRDKKTLTYASQQVSGEELMKAKGANFMDALNGKAAGMEIKKSASGAGGSTRVILRGFKSLAGSSEPLYVIDGIPIMNIKRGQPGMWGGTDQGDGLSQLNPDDIESVNVLKGLNASILYGSQGANGVVLITTKSGKKGKTTVSLSSTTTFESVSIYPELQFDYGAINGAKESWSDTKLSKPGYTEDMMKDFFQMGNNLINSVTISGGNDITTAYFSFSNTTSRGIVPNNKYGKNNISFKQSTKLFKDKLKITSNVMMASEKVNNRNPDGYYLNPLTGLYNFPRERDWEDYKENYKYFDKTRNMYLQNVYVVDHHLSNPYWIINMQPIEEKTQRVIATASADYKFTDHLSLILRGTYDYIDWGRTQKSAAGSNVTNVSANGTYDFGDRTDSKAYTDALLKYGKKFGKLDVVGYLGSSYSKNKWSGRGGNNGTMNLLYPNIFSTQNYPPEIVIGEYGGETILQSIYGSATVGYNDMFYVDISGRNDWSSTLIGTDNGCSYFYPSVGLVVLLSNTFNLPEFISFMKVRASSAKAAKEVPWNSIRSDHYIAGALGGIVRNTRKPWTDLKPEMINSNELGFEFRLFQSRIGFDFTYYNNVSTDQFLNVLLPPEERGEYTTKNINIGEIVNNGIEMTLDAIPVKSSSVEWKTSFNFSTNNNEITELDPDNPERVIHMGSSEGYATFLRKGGSYGDLYGFKFRRNDAGQIILDEVTGRPMKTKKRYDPSDWSYGYLGNLEPDFILGWNNNIQIGNINIGMLINGKFGGKAVSQTEAMLDGWGVSKRSGEGRDRGYVEINAIQGNTPVTQISAYNLYSEGGGTGGRNGIIEPYVYDRTNIRLSQLSVAYDFNVRRFNLPIKSATFSLVGQNLFFFYRVAPFDPELAMSTSNYSQSLDNFNLPATRTFGFNLKVTF